ncbi:MAG: hypothetical protein QME12_02980 [Nanoarchaeota archaeon]|nr:hypothetical protein [Nanoarchaeota archaeon]
MAVLENCQNKDGTVNVPKALVPYMNGLKVLGKNSYYFLITARLK